MSSSKCATPKQSDCPLQRRSVSQVSSLLRDQHAHICTTGCTQLQQLCLSRNLRIIEQEAFPKCTSLQEVSIPPSLLYIARRAFAGCAQLRAIRKQGKSKHGEGHMPDPMPLTNVSNSISPNGSDFCRPMPMIYGEKTF